MPYDFAGGFNQTNYNPSGYAGRQQGGRFAAYYGRDENGNLRTGPEGQAQPTPAAPAAAPGMNQGGSQADFFAQLAGLLGGPQGAPTTMGAGGGGYTNGPYGPNAYAQEAARMQGLRDASQGMQMVTGGGQGPTGGVSKEVQRGGMRGRMMAQGRASGGRTSPRQTNPGGGMAPPLRPRGPMANPNKPQGAMGMGEAKPTEGFGGMAPPLRPSPTPMPKQPPRKPMAMGEAKPMESFGRQRKFGGISNTRKQAGGFGGKF